MAGGSPADALKAGMLAGVMPNVTGVVGDVLAPATAGLGTVAQNAITSAVSSAVKAVVLDQDVGAALVSGGIGSLAGSAVGALNIGATAAKELVDQGLISTSKEISAVTAGINNTIGKMVGAGLTGGDVGGAAASGLVSTAVNTYNPAG